MHCHKILVVEDDDAIRTNLIDLLASEGFKAVPAHHGKEAVSLLENRTEDPCLIITDLMMPEMNGWELISFLKEQDIVITIPIVVLTSGTPGQIPRVKKVVKKPFNLEMIVALAKEHCGEPEGGPITKAQTHL